MKKRALFIALAIMMMLPSIITKANTGPGENDKKVFAVKQNATKTFAGASANGMKVFGKKDGDTPLANHYNASFVGNKPSEKYVGYMVDLVDKDESPAFNLQRLKTSEAVLQLHAEQMQSQFPEFYGNVEITGADIKTFFQKLTFGAAPANFYEDYEVSFVKEDGTLGWRSRNAHPGEQFAYYGDNGKIFQSTWCGNFVRRKAGKKIAEDPKEKNEVIKAEITYKKVDVEIPKFNITEKVINVEIPKFNYASGNANCNCGAQPQPACNCGQVNCGGNHQNYRQNYSCGNCGQNNCNGQCNINIRNKPNWTDVVNTIDNTANTVFNGINTFRGYRFENRPVRYGYNPNWGGQFDGSGGGGVFQGDNRW